MTESSLINKCIFPVAGFGSRFFPITKVIPKEMLPILSKPMIQFAVEEALSSGITSMNMITNKSKVSIKNYFDQNSFNNGRFDNTESIKETNKLISNCNFTYVDQGQMLGLGHAIYKGKDKVGNEPFAVILPDDICFNHGETVLSQMIRVYNQNQNCCIIAVEEKPNHELHKYGVIEGRLLDKSNNTFQVTDMIEKPMLNEAPSNFAIVGRYILTPDIFDILKKVNPDNNGEIQITDALRILAKANRVIAYKFNGERFDCGGKKGFVEATNFFAVQEKIV